jgi:uncharacterized protein (DUF427 family)
MTDNYPPMITSVGQMEPAPRRVRAVLGGLPTRYYLNRTEVNFDALEPSETVAQCPYKGRTTGYWSVRRPVATYSDLARSYSFPLPAVPAIAGLVCFYNEKVDIHVDGSHLPRPDSPFS